MSLSQIDRELLQRCLTGEEAAWRTFVDRFIGVVTHVVNHVADCRGVVLTPADREDYISEVLVTILSDDMAVLRRFRGASSLATYLTVIARRVATRRLMRQNGVMPLAEVAHDIPETTTGPDSEQRISNAEQVEQMLGGLPTHEAEVVRLYHLQGKSYQEISQVVDMPENSIGPLLSRARGHLRRRAGMQEPTG